MSTEPQPVPNTAALLDVLTKIATALGAIAAGVSSIYALLVSSPTLRGVIFASTATAALGIVSQVHTTKRSAHRASIADANAVAAVAAQRAAEAQLAAGPPGGKAA